MHHLFNLNNNTFFKVKFMRTLITSILKHLKSKAFFFLFLKIARFFPNFKIEGSLYVCVQVCLYVCACAQEYVCKCICMYVRKSEIAVGCLPLLLSCHLLRQELPFSL